MIHLLIHPHVVDFHFCSTKFFIHLTAKIASHRDIQNEIKGMMVRHKWRIVGLEIFFIVHKKPDALCCPFHGICMKLRSHIVHQHGASHGIIARKARIVQCSVNFIHTMPYVCSMISISPQAGQPTVPMLWPSIQMAGQEPRTSGIRALTSMRPYCHCAFWRVTSRAEV